MNYRLISGYSLRGNTNYSYAKCVLHRLLLFGESVISVWDLYLESTQTKIAQMRQFVSGPIFIHILGQSSGQGGGDHEDYCALFGVIQGLKHGFLAGTMVYFRMFF